MRLFYGLCELGMTRTRAEGVLEPPEHPLPMPLLPHTHTQGVKQSVCPDICLLSSLTAQKSPNLGF